MPFLSFAEPYSVKDLIIRACTLITCTREASEKKCKLLHLSDDLRTCEYMQAYRKLIF